MGRSRTLFLTLVAALSMSVVVASAASAASYNSEVATTYLTGSTVGTQIIQLSGPKTECATAGWSSQVSGTSVNSISSGSTTLGGCNWAGTKLAVAFNGCSYRLGEPTGSSAPFSVKDMSIDCPSGQEITIGASSAGCSYKIPPQTLTGSATVTNSGTGINRVVTVGLTASGIKFTSTGGVCGASGNNGVYSGTFLLKGYRDAARTKLAGIFVA